MVKVEVKVVDILGTKECSMKQRIGDTYIYPEDRGKMCPSAFHSLYPWILVFLCEGKNKWNKDDPNSVTLGCPDYKHQVVYKISRIDDEV